MPNISRKIPNKSDTAKKIRSELFARVRLWESKVSKKFKDWREAEEKILAYVPETELTAKRKADRRRGLPDYTTIQIPYSFAVVMAAHTYLTSVFLNRSPVLQYSGRHGESQQKVQAVEALMDYQMMNGNMMPYMYTWIYDALKYGYGVTCCWWDEKIEVVTELQEQPQMDEMGLPTGRNEKIQIPQLVRTYSGNRLLNIQPQDFIWDTRYPVREFQRGEFAGRRIKLGWNEVVRREKRGYYMNIEEIKSERTEDFWFVDRGSSKLDRPDSTAGPTEFGLATAGMNVKHPMVVDALELCVEIIPKEWGLGFSDWPEKWVFTVTADYTVLFGVQPLGAYHCSYPYNVIPLEPEGYGLTTRGLPEVLDPVQNTIDWLLNSHFYNVRAALNNKFVVDPSKVVMKDVMNPLPGGIIRLKPEAYGQDTRLAMTQMQVTDVTQGHLAGLNLMFGIGERAGGVNDQVMGMLDTGGRKTATEVRSSTSFSINRLKTMAEYASATGMDPLSRMMVQNSQQYYDMEMQFKIAGDLLQQSGPLGGNQGQQTGSNGYVNVNPDMIAGFYDFVPVDGTLPIDRMAQVNLWKEMLQAVLTVPQIGMQYDLGGIFQWVAQLAGLKNITRFKIQVTPDQILQAAAQSGNSVAAPTNGARQRARQPKTNPAEGIQQPGPPTLQ